MDAHPIRAAPSSGASAVAACGGAVIDVNTNDNNDNCNDNDDNNDNNDDNNNNNNGINNNDNNDNDNTNSNTNHNTNSNSNTNTSGTDDNASHASNDSTNTPGLHHKISVFSNPDPGKSYATTYENMASWATQTLAKILWAGILLWRPGVLWMTAWLRPAPAAGNLYYYVYDH